MTAPPSAFAAGRYRVERILGEGSQKRVYLAHDTRLGRDVAIAVVKTEGLDAGSIERVRREATAISSLGEHPHIVTVYDVGEEEGETYVVSQYMDGGSVADLLARSPEGGLAIPAAVRVASAVSGALAHVHAHGLVHRDVKPSNVWLTRDGIAKLGDFGLAVAPGRSRHTLVGTVVGTVAYMAPEQAQGRAVEPRTDLYCLGAMLYEMLTGRPPFVGDDPLAVIAQHVRATPAPPSRYAPAVPQRLDALVLQLLAKSPEERPPNAGAVREALAGGTASKSPEPASGAGTYTRRVCAVLVADISGFSTLMGEDDERTAQAVDQLRTMVRGVVADHDGRVEPVAGDAFFATFDSVVAAVDAAINLQRRIAAEQFAGHRLRIRIGVHLGDLLLRHGNAFGDAINIASRLQALARPGTICISDGVYRHVRRRFDEAFEDLGRRHLKNISDPVHAYLIVPIGNEDVHRARRRRVWFGWRVAAGSLILVATLIGWRVWPHQGRNIAGRATAAESPPAVERAHPSGVVGVGANAPTKITLGVMLFRPLGDEQGTAWMREALRDGLNTQLSDLSGVKVYSKEFIDFLTTRQGMTEIEAATKLNITKMLSGSFVVMGEAMRIETHVVDVATGVLESSVTTVGRRDEFLDLQQRMVFDVVGRLDVPVSEEERKTLLAKRNTDVDALRMLLEAEGKGGIPSDRKDRNSLLDHMQSFAAHCGPAVAMAEDAPEAANTEILSLLEHYRSATEQRDMTALAAVYAEFTPEQQVAQQRYFDNVHDLRVAFEDIDVAVVGDEAVVSYTRADDFSDARTGRPMHVSVRLTKMLRRTNGTWKVAGAR